ncbi:hypothetical protein H6P81_004635 [Aristolochia fimbriata]|uniref:Epidermal patterning factor-like protein n=1 Tax=Aristolochia fimbriata TaxID=158543 RepID=A0AAV7ETD0_ARIFI|nr:hypothetical protein H6P81_004635 [Aristolochia fimbriata]
MALRFSTALFALLGFFLFFASENRAAALHPQEQRRYWLLQNPDPDSVVYFSRSLLPRRRRRLAGPGSSPPTCRSKCGRCSPCKPVHVPIQPGRSIPLEYYPEAWRCKCGNRLFMP